MMREIAGYRILRRLGEGGMGSVHLAEAPDGRQVAVKVIRGELLESQEFRARFRSEVTRAQSVPPFSTAEVIEADPDHDPPYLVIEYVDGPNLAQVVRDSGPLKGAALHSLAVGVATALTAIHGAGVVHRDLKPGNVLLPRGSVKVIDFGIARELDTSTALTSVNQVMGTVPYISPERLSGVGALTPAADIFAWGAVITFAATGRTPFGGDTPATTAIRIMTEQPNLEGLTGPLRDIVAQALAKDPLDRPTARELLDQLLTGSVAPRTASVPRPAAVSEGLTRADVGSTMDIAPARPRRRGRRVAMVVGGIVTVLAVAAAVLFANGVLPLPGVANAGPPSTPSATPSPSPSRLGPREGMRFVLDKIDGNWETKDDPKLKAKCEVIDNTLRVTRADTDYRCSGAKDSLADVSVFADVEVSSGTCAAIWWHYRANPGGYVLQICEDTLIFAYDDNRTHILRSYNGFGTGGAMVKVRFGVVQRGDEVTFYRDDDVVGSWPATMAYVEGPTVLGILQNKPGNHNPAHVAIFSNIELYGNPPAKSMSSVSPSAS